MLLKLNNVYLLRGEKERNSRVVKKYNLFPYRYAQRIIRRIYTEIGRIKLFLLRYRGYYYCRRRRGGVTK